MLLTPLFADGRKKRGPRRKPLPRGTPAHVPSEPLRNLAKICAALNKTQAVTAKLMDISVDTLQRHYRAELEYGKANVDVAVTGKIVSAATAKEHTGPTIEAAKFWAKTQMGWKEPATVDINATFTANAGVRARDIIEGRLASIAERIAEEGDLKRLN